MYIYTVIITICKVGAIWSTKAVWRKTFQSASNIVFMIGVIKLAERQNKIEERYERQNNRKVYRESGTSSSEDRRIFEE